MTATFDAACRAIPVPGLLFDPYAREFAEDPYPIYKRLRDEAPVYHQEDLNIWVLSRYDDVWRAHRDAVTFSSAGGVTIEGTEANAPVLIVKDAPDHGWAKAMMTKVFSRSRMADLNPFIRQKAVELIERAAAKAAGGEVNFVDEFTVQLPLEVISELLGIPPSLRSEVHRLSNIWLMRGEDIDPAVQQQSAIDLIELYCGLAADRRARPSDDPISLLLATEIEDDNGVRHGITELELAYRFHEMALAGHETVAKAIPNGAVALARFPDERRRLQQNPSLMPRAVQEILRFDPPSQLQGRTTTREVTLHGKTIPAGVKTMLCTGSATRDERAFADPDRFDIGREMDSRTIAFGYGVHKCLGIHLAQQEIAIAFDELFDRFPEWEVFPDRTERSVLSNVRGLSVLPIVFGRHA